MNFFFFQILIPGSISGTFIPTTPYNTLIFCTIFSLMNTDTAVEGTSNEHIPSGTMEVDDDEEIDIIVDSSDSEGILTFKSTMQ